MSRTDYKGPRLPKSLLNQVHDQGSGGRERREVPRKDRRKAERQHKKSRPILSKPERPASRNDVKNSPAVKALKPVLKKVAPSKPDSEDDLDEQTAAPVVSRATKERLVADDAEISALEKKLGIKGKKSKALEEDGLDWLADGSDSDSDHTLKRKRPDDARWLRDKRMRVAAPDGNLSHDVTNAESGSDEDLEEIEESFRDDEVKKEQQTPADESDDFEGFEIDEDSIESSHQPKRQRENPYIAPVTGGSDVAQKYIPPSMRAAASSDEQALAQLRKRAQGLLNRLSEANLVSILKSLEELYDHNARQHVTSTLVDLLVGLVADRSTLNDTFLILHAGFSAAVYKAVGTDFGAQLLEKLVEQFEHHRSDNTDGKQTLNLTAFLSYLYTFQLVGSAVIFDIIRLVLDELTETNTELLLRIIRTAGQQLRTDDPTSLKDIVLILHRSVAKVGEDQLSVRTKFMIETINNLKNNRMKTGVAASTMTIEHVNRMKKTLGALGSARSLKVSEPLRVTMADIQDSEKKGKWWLVGAAYHDPAKLANSSAEHGISSTLQNDTDTGYESETPGSMNLHELARSQGMNTDVRRSIFITLLSSSDYIEAHMRLLKLHLKSKQMLEIPRVLVHCAGAEEAFNPFYALVARQFCADHKLRKAFYFTFWDALKQMGEGASADGSPDEDQEDSMTIKKVVNLARLYGILIANRSLDITLLKHLDFAYIQAKASMFVEVLLTTVFVQVRKASKASAADEVKKIFARAAGAPHMVAGLQYFVQNTVARAVLAKGKKETTAVEAGCRAALDSLEEAAKSLPLAEEDDDEDLR